jgi:hypothetical protein
MNVHTDGAWFRDDAGRTLLLRGVNLGGDAKTPMVPDGATHHAERFFDHRMVSFTGRPFPLPEAAEHLGRLKSWGLTFLRFLVTWEAIEHAGPGLYDTEYLDYLERVIHMADDMGFTVFIDPHQDVWSRFTGGDGAPGWTLEAAGFDMTHFAETCAAIVHQTHGDPFPHMVWPTNAGRLACATMFTLFFGGNDFAPHVTVDNEPIQEYLQRHYIDAVLQVVRRLKDVSCVAGYDVFNEPSHGYIGWKNLAGFDSPLRMDLQPTPLQSFALGEGIPQELGIWKMGMTGARLHGRRMVNPEGAHAWRQDRPCIWRDHGVWGIGAGGSPELLIPDYFCRRNDHDVDFESDYLMPFVRRYIHAVRAVDPKALIFVEGEPDTLPPSFGGEPEQGVVSAPHWYDAVQLLLDRPGMWLGYDNLRGRAVIGRDAVRRSIVRQLQTLRDAGTQRMHVPTVIGEIGIPLGSAHGGVLRARDADRREEVLNRSLAAAESCLCSHTVWNYTAGNTNEHGDGWNGEDFSIWSADQGRDPRVLDRGGRALHAVVRPYPVATAGEPLQVSFDIRRRILHFTFRHDPAIVEPTEIFVPPFQYPFGYSVWMTDGTFLKDDERHVLKYSHTLGSPTHTIIIRPKPAPHRR